VLASGKPVWVSNVSREESVGAIDAYRGLGDCCSAFAFPVLVEREVVAVLEFFIPQERAADREVLRSIAHAGTQLGRVVERVRLQRELVDAVWSQHRRFGQDVHDSLGQELTGIRMLTEGIRRKLEKQPLSATEASLDELTELVHDVQDHARQLSKGLFPVDIFEGSLAAALTELAETVELRSGISCSVQCDDGVDVSDHDAATHLFRIAQEASNNAVKHSGGDRVAISLRPLDRGLQLEVCDNGKGLGESGESKAGIGLRIMQYRATAIGGRLTIESREGGGTTVRCVVNSEA
jgi:signal transduction histidine kinase